jgi:hypothetical protein
MLSTRTTAYLFATHAKLDLVHTKIDMISNHFSHFVWPIGVSGDPSYKLAVSPRYFLSIR